MKKLADFFKKSEIIEIGEGDDKIQLKLASMTIADTEERNTYYKECTRKAMEYAKGCAEHIIVQVQGMNKEEMVNNIVEIESGALTVNIDQLNMENEKVLTEKELNTKREKEREKMVKKIRTENEKLTDDLLMLKLAINAIKSQYVVKFNDLINMPTLAIIVKDPETDKRVFSMNPDAENYIKNIDIKLYEELLDKGQGFMGPILQSDVRRFISEPDFLSLPIYVAKVGQ